jgi:hypothetical protein
MISAQDISMHKVPSVILNTFKKEFPKANDIEWELQGDRYNVEFEIGWDNDYEAWFTNTGKLIRYTLEISQRDLPIDVLNAIKNQYPGYHIDDAEKIIENDIDTYSVELENRTEELNLMFTKNGKLI